MSRVLAPLSTMSSTATQTRSIAHFLSSELFVAMSFSVLFHLLMLTLLLAGWQENKPVAAVVKTIKVRMLMQAPAPVPIVEVQAPSTPVELEKSVPEVVKPILKEPAKSVIEESQFAKKRVDETPVLSEERVTETLPPAETTLNEEAQVSDKQALEQTNKKVEPSTSQQSQSTAQTQTNTQSDANFDSSQYFPVDKKAPAYPSRALDKNIQGACTVSYTVTTDGRVENPEALSDCHAFFIKPSIEATKSFRYAPRMVDGKAVKVPNVKNTFQYRIE